MADPRVERLADVLVSYSLAVKAGELVVLEAPSLAAPLLLELYRRVLQAGAHPQVRVALEGLGSARLELGTDEQLDWISPVFPEDVERADARVHVLAPHNTREASQIDPSRQARASRARSPHVTRMLERSAAGDFRWVITAFPTQAAAQEAGMSLAEYEDFVFSATLIDPDDPLAAWQTLGDRIRRLAEWLASARELRILGEGTDLTLSVEGRTWIPCDGLTNLPDGELFTGPVETSAEGVIRFTYPAVFHHRAVQDVQLRFHGGEVVEARAGRGQEFLEEMIAMDEGASRIGEFAFGLNDGVQLFTGEPLFDEKIGGTVHLALGESYPESGGLNKSALHWDMVCDLRSGGEVYADGKLIYREGRFLDGRF